MMYDKRILWNTKDGVERIYIQTWGVTQPAIDTVKRLLDAQLITASNYWKAEVNSRCVAVEDWMGAERYPVKFFGNNKEIWVSSMTGGYRGTGPMGVVATLKMMGFDLSNEDKELIYTMGNAPLFFRKYQ